ncbi:MAG: hypothetical protein ACFCBU_12645 [Cyanophyceae cyanobacterium]
MGKVLSAPGFVFANDDNVIPDLVRVSNNTLDNCFDEAGHFTSAPELAVEVVSKVPQDALFAIAKSSSSCTRGLG